MEQNLENKNEANKKQASFGVVAQYAKDISFENFLKLNFQPKEGEEPKLDVKVRVDVQKIENNLNEVTLFLAVAANAGSEKIFLVELKYVGIFALENFPDELVKPTLYVECPRILFPFARAIVASTVSAGNMPMPLLPMIDFAEMFFSKEKASADAQ